MLDDFLSDSINIFKRWQMICGAALFIVVIGMSLLLTGEPDGLMQDSDAPPLTSEQQQTQADLREQSQRGLHVATAVDQPLDDEQWRTLADEHILGITLRGVNDKLVSFTKVNALPREGAFSVDGDVVDVPVPDGWSVRFFGTASDCTFQVPEWLANNVDITPLRGENNRLMKWRNPIGRGPQRALDAPPQQANEGGLVTVTVGTSLGKVSIQPDDAAPIRDYHVVNLKTVMKIFVPGNAQVFVQGTGGDNQIVIHPDLRSRVRIDTRVEVSNTVRWMAE